MFIANEWPPIPHIWDGAEAVQAGIRSLIDRPGPRPRFIGVHLFAYRTTLADIARLVANINDEHVHVVRGDVFLGLANRCQIDLHTGG
jgi:hypothetical protein